MPYLIKHLPHSHLVKMMNADTGRIVAKHTTLKKAEAQKRLLEGLHAGSIKHSRK